MLADSWAIFAPYGSPSLPSSEASGSPTGRRSRLSSLRSAREAPSLNALLARNSPFSAAKLADPEQTARNRERKAAPPTESHQNPGRGRFRPFPFLPAPSTESHFGLGGRRIVRPCPVLPGSGRWCPRDRRWCPAPACSARPPNHGPHSPDLAGWTCRVPALQGRWDAFPGRIGKRHGRR